jgi:hypothetical protein
MTVLLIIQSAVLVLLCILVAGLLRSYATVLQRLHELDGGAARTAPPPFRTAGGVVAPAPAGASTASGGNRDEWGPAHDLAGVGLTGEVISVRTVHTDFDTVLVFLSSGCAGCGGFWDDLAHRREAALVGSGRLLVVTKGPESESVGLLAELCPPGVDLVMSTSAWADYAVPGSPYVVVVDGPSGRVKGEGSGTSLTQVSGLVHQSLLDGSARRGDGPPAKPRSDADREVDVDRVLLSAGIAPGHPSLYGAGEPDAHFIGWPGVAAHPDPIHSADHFHQRSA